MPSERANGPAPRRATDAASGGGRIYVDLDDVLSDTVTGLLRALERLRGKVVRFEEVRHFDLGRSFGLGADELARFMREIHRPEWLEALEVRIGAADVLGSWLERGYEVALVTGRPPHTNAASQRWLAKHGIPHSAFHSVDKYARHGDGDASLSLESLAEMEFALAVEDSLETAVFLADALELPVALMDRPWNRRMEDVPTRARARITRVGGWHDVAKRFAAP
ncbi:MAG: bifunctional metallophosphatase/5'-nucleotidase [Deltaproteobacteria bacterium]|nr:MAG: bifunctional metallophosphatase/5'-nucleotidase [Deltaproteobacteria bacterium]